MELPVRDRTPVMVLYVPVMPFWLVKLRRSCPMVKPVVMLMVALVRLMESVSVRVMAGSMTVVAFSV